MVVTLFGATNLHLDVQHMSQDQNDLLSERNGRASESSGCCGTLSECPMSLPNEPETAKQSKHQNSYTSHNH